MTSEIDEKSKADIALDDDPTGVLESDDDDVDAFDDGDDDEPGAAGPRRGPNWLLFGALAILLAGLVCAVIFGLRWYRAGTSDAKSISESRDSAVVTAQQFATDFTSLDYRHLDAYKKALQSVTDGPLYNSLAQRIDQGSKQITSAKLVVTSKIAPNQAAATQLDDHAGTASVMVVVTSTPTTNGKVGTANRVPLLVQLTKINGQWKATTGTQTSPVGQ